MIESEDFLLDEFKDRELEILSLMAEGLSNAAIGEKLFITKETVRWYNKQIYSKLGTSRRIEAIAKAKRLGLIKEQATAVSAPPQRHNLPHIATPFLGRDKEIHKIKTIFEQPYTKLLTILGPGGMGKTRLTIEAGHQLIESYPEGVYLFELASLIHANSIVSVALQALGIAAKGSDSQKQKLFDYCRDKKLLLIFDNFEHLLDGAKLVHELSQAAPNCRILVTSRERLNLYGETILELTGLHENGPQLFEAVAHALDPLFQIDDGDAHHVQQIVDFVGGIPLGIILAASWIDSLNVAEIAEEVSQDLDMLSTEMQNLPERQRSMRTVLSASWRKLSAIERLACTKLAIFRGGFSRKAAKMVADTSIRLLQSLQHKSIIQQVSKRRFDLHPLVQQFAFEKLEESGRLRETREQHLNYFEAYVTDTLRGLEHGDYLYPLRDVELEKENVHMALDWGLAQMGELRTTAVKLTKSMTDYWYSRTYFGIGAQYCSRALSNLSESSLWARIVRNYCYFLSELGRTDEYVEMVYRLYHYSQNQTDVSIKLMAYAILTNHLLDSSKYDETINIAEQYWELSQSVANPRHMNLALNRLAGAYREKGNLDKAIEIVQMNVNLLRQQEDDVLLASATYNLGLSLYNSNNDIRRARQLFEESLALKRLIGDRGGILRRLDMLSRIALVEDEIEKAQAYLKEAESIVDSLDAPVRKLGYYGLLLFYLEMQADWPRAIQSAKEGVRFAVELNNKKYILFFSLALARFYIHANLPNQAKTYLERGSRLFFEFNIPRFHADCLLTFAIYWLAVNHLSNSVASFVYFLRLDGGNPTYKHEVDSLSLMLESHFSTEELDTLKANLPVIEPIELIGQYLDELSSSIIS